DAHFIVGTSDQPDESGINVPNEKGSFDKLGAYNKVNIIITLPNGKKIKDYKYLSVYCREAETSFGHVMIPDSLVAPKPAEVGRLEGTHVKQTGPVVLMDSMVMSITNFNFDGTVPGTFFLTGTGQPVSDQMATKLQDENSRPDALKEYANKSIILKLPDGAWAQYEWFSVYSISDRSDLAHIQFNNHAKTVPLHFNKVPPRQSTTASHIRMARTRKEHTYLGKKLGDLRSGKHGVSGAVYSATGNVLVLEDFSYDGTAPDAFFMVGTSDGPSKDGTVLRNEAGSNERLPAYSVKTFALKLPTGTIVTDFRWFSVYRKEAEMNIGDVDIPSQFDYPREQSIGSSLSGAHRTSVGEVVLKDTKTLFLKDFSYDGSAPDAFFLCGKGRPNPQGTKVPDENGRVAVLRGYSHVDLTLTLPGELTMFDIDWFAVYCITYTEIFISVTIPKNQNIPPPMALLQTSMQVRQTAGTNFENCETILPYRLQVAWKLESNSIVFELRTTLMGKEWAAFGISGDKDKNQMVGGDVAVVYLEGSSNKVKLEDYYLGSKAQCSTTSGGACPDTSPQLQGTNDLTEVSSKYENGILTVVYSRPLATNDRYDKTITPAGDTTVIAALGPLAKEPPGVVLYHTTYWTKSKTTLKLNRQAQNNCPALKSSQAPGMPKDESQFGGRDILTREGVTTFTARIGPTGGSRGYEKITGMWGNTQMVPKLYYKRDAASDFSQNTGAMPPKESGHTELTDVGDPRRCFACGKQGHLAKHMLRDYCVLSGTHIMIFFFSAVGRYCEWEHKSIDQSDQSKTFEEFKKTLQLNCEPDVKSGQFTWTPDEKTPDIVYYQCFTHYYLGWKIVVKNPDQPDEPLTTA
ncbi:unnamed protein product, partial [Ixodes hexagonus]